MYFPVVRSPILTAKRLHAIARVRAGFAEGPTLGTSRCFASSFSDPVMVSMMVMVPPVMMPVMVLPMMSPSVVTSVTQNHNVRCDRGSKRRRADCLSHCCVVYLRRDEDERNDYWLDLDHK